MTTPKKRQSSNPPLDRDALHRYLWDRCNHARRIKVHQGQLAAALAVTNGTISRVFKEMSAAGRIKKVDAMSDNIGIYQITDPDVWAEQNAAPPEPRRLKWS